MSTSHPPSGQAASTAALSSPAPIVDELPLLDAQRRCQRVLPVVRLLRRRRLHRHALPRRLWLACCAVAGCCACCACCSLWIDQLERLERRVIDSQAATNGGGQAVVPQRAVCRWSKKIRRENLLPEKHKVGHQQHAKPQASRVRGVPPHQLSSDAVIRQAPSGDHLTPRRKFELGVRDGLAAAARQGRGAKRWALLAAGGRWQAAAAAAGAAWRQAPARPLRAELYIP